MAQQSLSFDVFVGLCRSAKQQVYRRRQNKGMANGAEKYKNGICVLD